MLFKDMKICLIEYFKDLASDFGYQNKIIGDTIIKHLFTQIENPTLIGTSRPALNILLNELQNEDYLKFDRKEIIIKK